MQTRLDRHEQIIRALLWVVGIIAATIIAACTSAVVVFVRELLRP